MGGGGGVQYRNCTWRNDFNCCHMRFSDNGNDEYFFGDVQLLVINQKKNRPQMHLEKPVYREIPRFPVDPT